MRKLEKNKMALLKALMDLVKENLNFADVREELDSEVAELITDLKDRKRLRRLKEIKRELEKLIVETVSFEKLREQTSQDMEIERKRVKEYYASDPSNRDQ